MLIAKSTFLLLWDAATIPVLAPVVDPVVMTASILVMLVARAVAAKFNVYAGGILA
jgi:hypothetical protein